MKVKSSGDLQQIPGVGENIAAHLNDAGVYEVADLKSADPEKLYAKSCHAAGQQIDRCLLYVYRCAVYYSSHKRHDPEKLKWWNWKDSDGRKTGRRTRRKTRPVQS